MPEKRLLNQLFVRLTPEAMGALEAGLISAKQRHQRYCEMAHWLDGFLRSPDSDLHRIVDGLGLGRTRILAELEAAIEGYRRGREGGHPIVAQALRELVRDGWLQAEVGFGDRRIRGGHLLLAALHDDELREALELCSPVLAGIRAEDLAQRFEELTRGSPEAPHVADSPSEASAEGRATPSAKTSAISSEEPGKTVAAVPSAPGRRIEALASFTEDLTEKARSGKLDPIVGRDDEIRRLEQVLLKRKQNNPILVGDAGVGKTAVVEGFAVRVARGQVADALKGISVRAMDVTRMQAGAGVRGEFENRLKKLLDEVREAGNVVLFVDETHTLIGAGGSAGTGDAANLLKPALARGELRTIGATTSDEYRKFIEGDPALQRRFEAITVLEPTSDKAVEMLRHLTPMLAKHHGVAIREDGLRAAVEMTIRYVPARQLPDKAVAALDTACSRVSVSRQGTPAAVEDLASRIAALETEEAALAREERLGVSHTKRLAELRSQVDTAKSEHSALGARWEREKAIVAELHPLYQAAVVSPEGAPTGTSGEGQTTRSRLESELSTLQGEAPLVLACVDEKAVAAVIGEWTGIPVGRMVKDKIATALTLPALLGRRVVGQDHALHLISDHIRTAEARLHDPNKPLGSFLLVGPSGVGKTETALALAEMRYGSERNLIVFNMNEFKERHTASTLLGAPPGYKGYEKGGLLTEAIRRRPYSVVLFDEFEKAHTSIRELFFQVLDQGWTRDRDGRFIDFRNTLLLFTSNAASDVILERFSEPEVRPTETKKVVESVRPELSEHFAAALLGRLTIVPYFPLAPEVLRSVVELKLSRVQRRLRSVHDVEMSWESSVPSWIGGQCKALETGGRTIDAIVTNALLPQISVEVLQRILDKRPLGKVLVRIEADRFALDFC